MSRPNVLFVMTDQQRFDTIAALGNPHIHTPNLDRLVRRGVSFTNAYSTCPVCVPARYTIRTGCFSPTTACYRNGGFSTVAGQGESVEDRCGPYLGRRMTQLGYRTFGVGKFHTAPMYERVGYEVQLHSEELWGTPQERLERDAYGGFIAREHPEFAFVEQLHGERTEMYYMPQTSPLPAGLTVEAWAADRAAERIAAADGRPWFGFVSFIGPHPPFAPPIPYNRMYDPDRMPDPVRGRRDVDHMDEQIPWMNRIIWADDISAERARILKARYYGEITYIDACLGRILDAIDARPDADNTVVCFFSDHGDHLGDHDAWQKESFFEGSARVPLLLSWPARLPAGARSEELVCLADLFGIATTAAGEAELREGVDALALAAGGGGGRGGSGGRGGRETLVCHYEDPGTPQFKAMVRRGPWKYIWIANGGREQLFCLADDPNELALRNEDSPDVLAELRAAAVAALSAPNADRALDGGRLRAFPFQPRPTRRIYQFSTDRGVRGFPGNPADALK